MHLGRRHSGGRRYNAAEEASIPRELLADSVREHRRAIAFRAAGRFAEAELACRRAIDGYRTCQGPSHPDVANALVELGLVLEARDRLREAARCHTRAVAICARTTSRAGDADLARLELRARIALAGIHRALGDFVKADGGYAEALAKARRLGARDPFVASIHNNLGVLRKAQGRLAEAAACYKRALTLAARTDRDFQATLAHNLGGIEHAQGRYLRAEPHARRSVELREAVHGPNHPAVAADLAALAAILEGQERFAEAAAHQRRALAIFRRRLGAQSLEVGLGLASLAAMEQQRGRFEAARPLYAKALRIQEAILGPRHVDVALTVNNLAVLERDDGHLDRAAALFDRAFRRFHGTLGPAHPHTLLAAANGRAVAAERVKPPKSLKTTGKTRR